MDYAPIPSTSAPNDLIAAFWDDLNPSAGGAVYYLLEGTAPNRRLTIEWNNLPHYSNIGAVTFEATLYEGSNDMIFQYQNVGFGSPTYDNGVSATIGIEEVNGIVGLQYSYNQAVISNGTAILFSYNNLDCDIQMSQTTYTAGDTVTAQVFRLANSDTNPVSVALNVWLGVPSSPPILIINMGADGSFVIPAGFDQDFGPIALFPAAGKPLGLYEFSCRMWDPVAGELLVEDRNPFTIQ